MKDDHDSKTCVICKKKEEITLSIWNEINSLNGTFKDIDNMKVIIAKWNKDIHT